MSIFYDPHSKRPQVWIYPFFAFLTIGLVVVIYYYGDQKAKKSPTPVENTLFEKAEE